MAYFKPRLLRTVAGLCLVSIFAACTTPNPTPIVITATPGPVGISVGEVTSEAPFIFSGTITPGVVVISPSETATPTPVPFKALNICLPTEPLSLYEYSGGDRDALWARDVVLETLRDGPIDHRNFEYQPVLLEKLPNFKDTDAVLQPAQVADGQPIIDVNGNITALANGVRYFDPIGNEQAYPGGGSVSALQMKVTFKLRPGLKWEDGQPLTAEDVWFGWRVAKDPTNTASDHYLANRAFDPVVVDSQTLEFTFFPTLSKSAINR